MLLICMVIINTETRPGMSSSSKFDLTQFLITIYGMEC